MRTPYRFALLLSLVACNGTDVGNPPRGQLTEFKTSPCKKTGFDKGVDPLPAWQPDPTIYAGLSCILWETSGNTLRVRLTNHRDACGLSDGWKPRAQVDDTAVDLLLDNPSCTIAGCGNCVYDLAFDVRLTSVPRGAPSLSLRVLGDDCGGTEREVYHQLELAGVERDAGARCEYTFPSGGGGGLTGNPAGKLGGSCGNTGIAPGVVCQEGVCTPVNDKFSICLNACSSDDDCKASDVLACLDGACQLRSQP